MLEYEEGFNRTAFEDVMTKRLVNQAGTDDDLLYVANQEMVQLKGDVVEEKRRRRTAEFERDKFKEMLDVSP